jgi:TonB family protein
MIRIKRISHLITIVHLLFTLAICNSAKAQDVISAVELTKQSDAAHDRALKNKTLKVKGIVTHNTGDIVLLQGVTLLDQYYVCLSIPTNKAHSFAKVQEGDEIIIQGRYIGRSGATEHFVVTQINNNVAVSSTQTWNHKNILHLDNCSLLDHKSAAEVERAVVRSLEASNESEDERIKREFRESTSRRAQWERDVEAERLRVEAERRREAEETELAAQRQAERRRTQSLISISHTVKSWYIAKANLVYPEYSGGERGQVTIKVSLNWAGGVKSAELLKKRTTIKDPLLIERTLEAARRTKFTAVELHDGQDGTITYKFSP